MWQLDADGFQRNADYTETRKKNWAKDPKQEGAKKRDLYSSLGTDRNSL